MGVKKDIKDSDVVVTHTIVEEKIRTVELDEEQLCAILRERFSCLGDRLEISINCSGYFDSVTIRARNNQTSSYKVSLSNFPK